MEMIIVLLASVLCSALAFPLCFLAVNFQKPYSIAVSAILILTFLIIITTQIKKHGIKASLLFFLKILIIAGGLLSSFILILNGNRLFALLTIILAAVLFFLALHFLNFTRTELSTEKHNND